MGLCLGLCGFRMSLMPRDACALVNGLDTDKLDPNRYNTAAVLWQFQNGKIKPQECLMKTVYNRQNELPERKL